ELSAKTGCEEGLLAAALRTCCALGYLELEPETGLYFLAAAEALLPGGAGGTGGALSRLELEELRRCLGSGGENCAAALRSIYAEAAPPFGLPSEQLELCLRVWSEHRHSWKNGRSWALASLLDGIVLVPLLASIGCMGSLDEQTQEAKPTRDLTAVAGPESRATLQAIFEELNLGSMDLKGVLTLSSHGLQVLQRVQTHLLPTSELALMQRFAEVLAKSKEGCVANTEERHGLHDPVIGQQQTETHSERTPADWCSGALCGEKLFEDMMPQLDGFFSNKDFAAQPRFVVDTGCRDGALLIHIYEYVKMRTPRGEVLHEFPLTMVGVDSDESALVATAGNLCKRQIPYRVFSGDVDAPGGIISAMKLKRIDPSRSLHVRACQDQRRSFIAPKMQLQSAPAVFAEAVLADLVHLERSGARISPRNIFAALVEHMQRWADAVDGSFGLCLLEEMLLDVPTTRRFMSESASFHTDLVRCLAQRYTVPAPAFALAAAMAGLLPADVKNVRPYPTQGRYCHTLSHFLVRRPFKIRLAEPSDLPSLERLEEVAWAENLRAPREGLLRRLEVSPTTNFAVEVNGEVVAVLYTQRINSPEDVHTQQFQRVSDGHVPKGRVLQLIAIAAHSDHGGIGSELRCFALHLARIDPSIDSVCAVTLCRNYAGSGSRTMQEYVDKHVAGVVDDRILTFHTGYGAEIISLVPGYRPEDTDNEATGVLIQYRPKDWMPKQVLPAGDGPHQDRALPARLADKAEKPAQEEARVPQTPTADILSEIMRDLGAALKTGKDITVLLLKNCRLKLCHNNNSKQQ
ncbi:unnamed protein product, partial [Polarella glacialis]